MRSIGWWQCPRPWIPPNHLKPPHFLYFAPIFIASKRVNLETSNLVPHAAKLWKIMPVLFVFNLQTKFKMSSLIRSRDMAWARKCKNESRDPDHGWGSHGRKRISCIFLLKNSSFGSNLYVTWQYIMTTPRGGESHINSRGWGIFPGVEFTTPGGGWIKPCFVSNWVAAFCRATKKWKSYLLSFRTDVLNWRRRDWCL